jgi:hypothetical protein
MSQSLVKNVDISHLFPTFAAARFGCAVIGDSLISVFAPSRVRLNTV